jgi:hypothetical protein
MDEVNNIVYLSTNIIFSSQVVFSPIGEKQIGGKVMLVYNKKIDCFFWKNVSL